MSASDRTAWLARVARRLTEGPLSEPCVFTPVVDDAPGEPVEIMAVLDRQPALAAFNGPAPVVGSLTDGRGRAWQVRPRLPQEGVSYRGDVALASVAAERLPAGDIPWLVQAGVATLILTADERGRGR